MNFADIAVARERIAGSVLVSPALLKRLEPIAVPRRFRLVAALPREDNGKLVRARLLALFEDGTTHV